MMVDICVDDAVGDFLFVLWCSFVRIRHLVLDHVRAIATHERIDVAKVALL